LFAWVTRSPRPLFALAVPALRGLLRLGGVRLEIAGRERLDPDTAYVFVANHVSNLDPPVCMVSVGRDVRAVAKAELFRIPVLGQVFAAAGFPAVDRSDRSQAIGALGEAAEALSDGHDFLAFPEGTRGPSGSLASFKKGPFVMALSAGAPVAPLLVHGTRDLLPPGTLLLRPGIVRVQFLDPVSTDGLGTADRDTLRDQVHGLMSTALAAEAEVLH
jgi:1-acyl-sn-glycerol-3-phosphate acyltransferase